MPVRALRSCCAFLALDAIQFRPQLLTRYAGHPLDFQQPLIRNARPLLDRLVRDFQFSSERGDAASSFDCELFGSVHA